MLVEDLPQVAEHLRTMLLREPEVEVMGIQPSAEAALAQTGTERPDVVMIDALLQDKKLKPFDLAKKIRAASPGTRIVVVTVPQQPVTPRPDEGIDAVFVLPGGANELGAAIGAETKPERHKADIVAVFSPKGGSGKTTIAVNLACHLRHNGASVALMDGVMQFGSVRALVATPADARSIVDLPAGAGMGAAIGDALWEGPAGVTLLLAPPKPEEAELVASSEIANAVKLLAQRFDYVIVDTPSRLSDDVLAVLDNASSIILVLNYDPAAIANTRAVLDTFRALGYTKPILPVVNRSDITGGLTRAAVEHQLNIAIIAEIPNDAKTVPDAANKQSPFILSAPAAPVSQAIAQLSTVLIAQQRKA